LTRSASSSSATSRERGAPAERRISSSRALTHSARDGSSVGGSPSPGHARCSGGAARVLATGGGGAIAAGSEAGGGAGDTGGGAGDTGDGAGDTGGGTGASGAMV